MRSIRPSWNDPPRALGAALALAHPDLDPWAFDLAQVADLVIALPDFRHDPAECDEGRIYATQCQWSTALEGKAR